MPQKNFKFTAWAVLTDAEAALEYLEQETDETRFRILWVATVSLLRTIGHVLDKIESERSNLIKEIVKKHWNEWKTNPTEHQIFHDFIEDERNG
ncbi:MAG: hypothetical protein ABSG42_04635, partial [Nitrospirota bacterium]